VFESVAEQLSVKSGAVFLSVRIAVLGKKATPPLPESLQVLGRERVLARLDSAALLLQKL
ncbi:MAG: hypothetical protein KDD70_19130, partial [Bdellovibrionales bacterium]|nr:hypothetical protein [Bdellovibrionales bacterium]